MVDFNYGNTKITGQKSNNDTSGVDIMVPLKYLRNFGELL